MEELDASEIDLSSGAEISGEATGLADMAVRFVEIFGIQVNTSLALIIVAAGCFYIGVLTACIVTSSNTRTRVQILATSPMAFLLTSPIWFPLMNGDLIKTSIAPIDAFFKTAVGDGELHNQMFLLGIVMLFGAMSLPIYTLAQGLFGAALSLVRKQVGPDEAPQTTPPSPPTTD